MVSLFSCETDIDFLLMLFLQIVDFHLLSGSEIFPLLDDGIVDSLVHFFVFGFQFLLRLLEGFVDLRLQLLGTFLVQIDLDDRRRR